MKVLPNKTRVNLIALSETQKIFVIHTQQEQIDKQSDEIENLKEIIRLLTLAGYKEQTS